MKEESKMKDESKVKDHEDQDFVLSLAKYTINHSYFDGLFQIKVLGICKLNDLLQLFKEN